MTKEAIIVRAIEVLLVFMAIIGVVMFLLGGLWWIPAIVCVGIPISLFVAGLLSVQQQERLLIEAIGRYFAQLRPGLNWILRGIMKVRAVVDVWEQTVGLFKEPIKVDFRDGSATPKGAKAFLKIKNPDTPYKVNPADSSEEARTGVYRAIYYVDNWEKRAIEQIENTVRSYLATLYIDEALQEGRGGFNLLTANRIPRREKNNLRKTLETWGLDLMIVTITDFDLELDLVKARGEVQKRKRMAEAALEEKRIRGIETMGSLIQMIAEATGKKPEEIQSEIKNSSELEKELRNFAKELITRRMSIDGKALTDIVTGGGGDIEQGLLRLIAAFKAIPGREK